MKNLESFKEHPFQVRDDDEMQDLVERINKYGVIEPLIVRPKENGNYEIISRHRRKRASELAHYREIPCIIRNVDDDTATIMMVDSNNKREHLLPSEKAFAYKMRLDAEKRQGNRTDLTSSPLGTKLENYNTAEKIGELYGDSKNTVYRYIRLTELLPEILNKVDEGIIGFRPAVEISYLSKYNQRLLLDAIEMNDATPTYSQALKLKELNKDTSFNDMGSITHASCCVANGDYTLAIFTGTEHKNCDIAAAKIIVEEAGGKVTDLFGKKQRYDKSIDGAVISNRLVHKDVIKIIEKYITEN